MHFKTQMNFSHILFLLGLGLLVWLTQPLKSFGGDSSGDSLTTAISSQQRQLEGSMMDLKAQLAELKSQLNVLKMRRDSVDRIPENRRRDMPKGLLEEIRDELDSALLALNVKINGFDQKIHQAEQEEYPDHGNTNRKDEEDSENSDDDDGDEDEENDQRETVSLNGGKARGGAFLCMPRILFADTDPLRYLAAHEKNLVGKTFNFDRNRLLGFDLGWNFDIGSGTRFGNEISFGYKRFQSDIYSDTVFDPIPNKTVIVDSITILRSISVHLGFVGEKAFRLSPVSFHAGAMLGIGFDMVLKNSIDVTNGSAFIDNTNDADSNYTFAYAPSMKWDFRLGASYQMAPYMHIGAEWLVLFSYAPEGYFFSKYGDYFTVSPGIRIRITLGKG